MTQVAIDREQAVHQAERPSPLAKLPFTVRRTIHYGSNCIVVDYEGKCGVPQAEDKVIPFSIVVGAADGTGYSDPCGLCIVRLVEMYRDLEAARNDLASDREKLLTEATMLRGEVDRLKERLIKETHGRGQRH